MPLISSESLFERTKLTYLIENKLLQQTLNHNIQGKIVMLSLLQIILKKKERNEGFECECKLYE